jgi:Ca-activated chloride channel family protein
VTVRWTVTLPVANAAEGKGLSKVWAQRKIADAEVRRTMRQSTPEEADKADPGAGARTSAGDAADQPRCGRQDAEPARGETLKLAELPLNLPAGWEFDKVFGERLQQAGSSGARTDAGCSTAC